MNSAANLLVTKNRTILEHDIIDKLVVLRMNRPFMMMTRKRQAATYVTMGNNAS
jgi:hypothetical protein